uniref:RRM domain-containing protein n=1 Tax=Gouania willdenowi TaxID=441366 RepID=A0A8C5HLN9_GOUWI
MLTGSHGNSKDEVTMPNNSTVVNRGPRPVLEGQSGKSEGPRMVCYPDAHQLFVGNIPHDVKKTELMEFFEWFGTSTLRGRSQRPPTRGGGTNKPSFGSGHAVVA